MSVKIHIRLYQYCIMMKELEVSNMIKKQQQLFQNDLLNWFEENKRQLPWRLTQNPYYIWISEVMLQQTQVDTVIPYYERFIHEFPTPEALADASQEQVYKLWEGLGYYSRARNLHQGVREVVEQYEGAVPDNKKDILKIKGIGPYTAGAILSIAYDKKEPAVDGNVMRVLSRVFLIDDDIMQVKTRKRFEAILYELIPERDPSSFNQGLMELGALICKHKNPKCDKCPVATYCGAQHSHVQENYPVKKKKQAQKVMDIAVLVVSDETKDHYLIQKRPDQGLLASLWEFPTIECSSVENEAQGECRQYLKSVHQLDSRFKPFGMTFTHTFSHIKWNITVFEGPVLGGEKEETDTIKWVPQSDIQHYPLPIPHQKILKRLMKNTSPDKIQEP